MKYLTKNWLAFAAVGLILVVGGYLYSGSYNNQSDTTTTNEEEEIQSQVELTIDYSGEVEKEAEVKTVMFTEGGTAWSVLKDSVGEKNIEFTDYGGDLGVFVTGINGVTPTGDKFWLFNINGNGADVGPSSYTVKEGDKIEFKISEPMEGV